MSVWHSGTLLCWQIYFNHIFFPDLVPSYLLGLWEENVIVTYLPAWTLSVNIVYVSTLASFCVDRHITITFFRRLTCYSRVYMSINVVFWYCHLSSWHGRFDDRLCLPCTFLSDASIGAVYWLDSHVGIFSIYHACAVYIMAIGPFIAIHHFLRMICLIDLPTLPQTAVRCQKYDLKSLSGKSLRFMFLRNSALTCHRKLPGSTCNVQFIS